MIMGAWGLGRKRLPYDAEVKYLQATGTQWIDTGVCLRDNLLIRCRYRITHTSTAPDVNTSWIVFGGAYGLFNMTRASVAPVTSSYGKISYMLSKNTTKVYEPFADFAWHDLEFDTTSGNTSAKWDGITIATGSGTNTTAGSYGIALYAFRNYNGNPPGASTLGKIAIASFSVTDKITGELVADFIPVRIGSVGCMYDRVTGQLFMNQGADAFVLGEDISEKPPEEYWGLCFESFADGSRVLVSTSGEHLTLLASTDCISWRVVEDENTKIGSTYRLAQLNRGDKVWVKAGEGGNQNFGGRRFYIDGYVGASGNIMSLINGTTPTYTIPSEYCFHKLFYNIANLVSAPRLPATVLAKGCYKEMFYGCYGIKGFNVGFPTWDMVDEQTTDWLPDSGSTYGNFICPTTLATETGNSRMPRNWKVIHP